MLGCFEIYYNPNKLNMSHQFLVLFFYALFVADFSSFILVWKFYCRKRNSQRNTSHDTGILALGDCFVDYITFFAEADHASKGSN